MNLLKIYFPMLALLMACNLAETETNQATEATSISSGILRIHPEQMSDTLHVLDANQSYASLFLSADQESVQVIKKDGTNAIETHAFYPDYDLYVMDAQKLEGNRYEVWVDGKWLELQATDYLEYMDWPAFLQEYLLGVNPDVSPLRAQKSTEAERIPYIEGTAWEVLKIDGDWLQVKCACGDCSNSAQMAWIKWREGDELLIEYPRIC